MKKTLIFVLVFTFAISLNAFGINIMIDHDSVLFNEQSGTPFLDQNKRTQVPLRITMEALGANVEWDDVNKVAIVEKNNISIKIPIGQEFIIVNDEQIANDTEAIIQDNRTYLPIRTVAESLGVKVFWDADTQSVILSSNKTDMYVVDGIGEHLGYKLLKGHKLQDEIDIYYKKEGTYLYSSWKLKNEINLKEKIAWIDWDGNKRTSTREEIYNLLDNCVDGSRLFSIENSKYVSLGLRNPYNDKLQYAMENIPIIYNDWANIGTAREYAITSIIDEYENGFE